MTMLMAGLTHGALQKAGVPTNASTISGLGKHAANQTVHAGVKAGVDLTLTGKVDLKSTTLAVAANTASAFIANHISTWHRGSDGTAIEAIAHKALHAINAGGRGFLVGGEKGMAASAIGAVVAERPPVKEPVTSRHFSRVYFVTELSPNQLCLFFLEMFP
jgi:hypothetical protein